MFMLIYMRMLILLLVSFNELLMETATYTPEAIEILAKEYQLIAIKAQTFGVWIF